ncbi:MAG: SMP-30/gluconolactonase/LRE family protein [Ktedonobacteraceae bacterium]|nr:SMP-30/gluconolactonase/LRE family protein [Ktedonobacteraceae bacterium]
MSSKPAGKTFTITTPDSKVNQRDSKAISHQRSLVCLLPFFLFILLISLSACSDEGVSRPAASTRNAQGGFSSQPPHSVASIATGNFREYNLPQAHSGLMRPVVDRRGRIWFGEMSHNFLTVFDPATQQFTQLTLPGGAHGIMGIAVAPDDTIWFAEQYANYIGHYDPAARRFQTYALPSLTIPDPGKHNQQLTLPSAPNDIALDAQGNVWFTELNADSIGRLDPRTGIFRHYPLTAIKSVQTLNPYGITVDAHDLIWFTEAATNRLGSLDPITGQIRQFTVRGTVVPLMEVASDAQGIIWATGFSGNLLLKFDPATTTFTTYIAPSTHNNTGSLYGLTITADRAIWLTVAAENVIARFEPASHLFTYYRIPTASSLPLGIAAGPDHTLWFTEAGGNKLGMLKP